MPDEDNNFDSSSVLKFKKQWCYVQAENSIQAYQDTLAAGNLDANSQVFVTLFTPEFTNPD